MVYDTDIDPYINPATGVLRNFLGINSADELANAEADLTATAIAILPEDPVPGDFNLAHLQAIHKRLFGAIYPWAGELMDPAKNLAASIKAYGGDETDLVKLLAGLVKPAVWPK